MLHLETRGRKPYPAQAGKTRRNHLSVLIALIIISVLAINLLPGAGTPALKAAAGDIPFEHVVIDQNNPSEPHNKTLADIDGDGFLDAIVASNNGDGMFWYEYPNWTKHAIRSSGSWTTDMQAGDIDGDGDMDVIVPGRSSNGIFWYENPLPGGNPRSASWSEHLIGSAGYKNHDVEVADVDLDGDLDVVSRKKTGGGTYFWRQNSPTSWTQITVTTRSGEGTDLGDVDGDGDIDVAQNGFWVEQVSPTNWTDHDIDSNWPRDTGVRITDLNSDGRKDIVLVPSESGGRFSWYETSNPKSGPWTEHSIDGSVSYIHTFQVFDMDRDGDLDLVTAEMHQSSNPDEVSIYFNEGSALSWRQQIVATSGSHNIRVGDIGSDGDLDIFGANWNDSAPNSAVIEYWENQLDQAALPLDDWERHSIDGGTPWQPVMSHAADMNGDGHTDIVAGGWWYQNPGDPSGAWSRRTIGSPLNNMAWVKDFDGDGDLDVLGTTGKPDGESFVWGRNDGAGNFTIMSNVASGDGDFLQGVAGAHYTASGPYQVGLSWHQGGKGVQMLTVPTNPASGTWTWQKIYSSSQDEALSAGDIDGDGDLDLFQGTRWLRNDGGSWTQFTVNSVGGAPDRNRLADLDGDGDLDAVVGFEGGGTNLVWLQNPSNPTGTWTLRNIATGVGGGYSMDVADMDHDGDVDVVLGEHENNHRVIIYENVNNASSWTAHVADSGGSSIDHHDGTHPVDIDGDGDLDIISIGWYNDKVWLFENKAIDGGSGPTPTVATPTISPNGGVFTGPVTVSMATTTSSATIHYTTDGSMPTESATEYTGPFQLTSSGAVKARAFRDGFNPSGVAVASFNDPLALPGRLQAEDYNQGGEGVAYHDTSSGNNGGQYRSDDVDIQATSDLGGGYNVGWVSDGEWLAYDVNISQAGLYQVTARVATNTSGTKTLHLEVDGADVTGPMSFSGATGWQDWRDVSVSNVSLSAGPHQLKVFLDANSFNLNYLDFLLLSEPDNQAPTVHVGPNQSIALPGGVNLDATVTDDGLPDGALDLQWTASGPGTVTFADPTAADTTASFSQEGAYILTLTADDGELDDSASLTVNVAPESDNQAPVVEAGPNRSATMSSPAVVELDGSASDDGKPDGALFYQWTAQGPASVAFGNAASASTTATFNTAGEYSLTLTASDGELAGSDSLTVTVYPEGGSGLVVHLPLDDGSGLTATDASGNGHHGALTNGPVWVTGQVGGGLRLDGSDDFVALGNLDVVGSGITMAAWVYLDDRDGDIRFIAKATGTSEDQHWWMLGERQDKIRMRLKTGSTTHTLIGESGADLPTGQWVHVAGTYDGSQMVVYMNGVAVDSVFETGAVAVNPSVGVAIGKNPAGTGHHLDGMIDDVRIYNRGLGAAEVAALAAGVPPANQSPVSNAGPDRTVVDSDDNGSASVTLDGSQSFDPDGSIVSYAWSQGATPLATGVAPAVDLAVGAHTLTLTVTDDEGDTDTDQVVITVVPPANQSPMADAGPDQTVTDSDDNGSESVTLDGSGSNDPDGSIVSYVWTEGGQQVATGANPTVSLSFGVHQLTLTVTDDDGATDTDTMTVTFSVVYGDLDGDGQFGAADLHIFMDWLMGLAPLPAPGTRAFLAGDVNGDGDLDIDDAALMVQRLSGAISKFPVEP